MTGPQKVVVVSQAFIQGDEEDSVRNIRVTGYNVRNLIVRNIC